MTGTLSTTEHIPASSNGSASDSGTTVVDGGMQYIGDQYGTGSATDTTIYSGGVQFLGDGMGTTGYATSTTISGGVAIFFYSGVEVGDPVGAFQDVGLNSGTGIATSTSILRGGAQYVGDNYGTGTATDTTISGGDYTYVYSETLTGTTVGGSEYTYEYSGTATENDDFSYQYVGYYNGTGTATGTTILNGGVQILGDATNNGDDAVGYATSTTIESGGVQDVGYELGTAYATSTIVDNGGVQNVGDGYDVTATAIGTILSGGADYLDEALQNVAFGFSASATVISTTIDADGIQYVGSGVFATGYATSTTISGRFAEQEVGFGNGIGSATDTIIYSGGNQTVGGQNIHGIGGTGYATSTTVYSGGEQTLGFVGTGYATGTILSGGVQQDGFTDAGIGYATDTTIDSGGSQYVSFEGTGYVTGTTINSGGVQYVGYDDGIGTATDTTIYSGGVQDVGHDSLAVTGTGMAISTTISGGTQYVSFEGTATDTTIYGGGVADIVSGGVADDVIIDGGTLELAAGASIGAGVIDFAAIPGANGGTLDLTGEGVGSSFTLTAAISGFTGDGGTAALSDIIDVAGAGATDKLIWKQEGASGRLQVEGAGKVLESLTLDGTYSQKKFVLSDPQAGVDQIAYNAAACFCAGTRIATEHGEVAVEDLSVGETLVTASGALRPIVWIGHRRIDISRHPDPDSVRPVRVRANAFDEGLPRRDLWLSPGHNVACEGALTPISVFVNGLSVAQIEPASVVADSGALVDEARAAAGGPFQQSVEYWHVELDAHDILLAEGLPAESYLDTGNRNAFANGGAFIEAHPDFKPKHWADTCLPLVEDGPPVARTKARLLERLAAQGYRVTHEANAHILIDGMRVEPIGLSATRLAFALPAGGREIVLRSDVFVPARTLAESADPRALGLCVGRLQIDGSAFALERDEGAAPGWRALELADGRFSHRWTTGETPLAAGARIVIVDLAGVGYYLRDPADKFVALSA